SSCSGSQRGRAHANSRSRPLPCAWAGPTSQWGLKLRVSCPDGRPFFSPMNPMPNLDVDRHQLEEKAMDENRTADKAEREDSAPQGGLGHVFEEAKCEMGDVVNQVHDATKDLYGQARESASQIADAGSRSVAIAPKTASSLERVLREMIETKPYTTALI